MTNQEIQQLIDRYLAGDTALEEERRLALELEHLALSEGFDTLSEEWQTIRLMLGELTLGEALYDELMATRASHFSEEPSAVNVSSAVALPQTSSTPDRHFPLWRWAAAAVVVLAAGLSVMLYQHDTFSSQTTQEIPASGKEVSRQRETSVPPAGNVRPANGKLPHASSQQETPIVASVPTTVHTKSTRKKARPTRLIMKTPELPTEDASPLPHNEDRTVANPSPSPAETDLALMARQVQGIRQRGERLQHMIDAIISDEPILANR